MVVRFGDSDGLGDWVSYGLVVLVSGVYSSESHSMAQAKKKPVKIDLL